MTGPDPVSPSTSGEDAVLAYSSVAEEYAALHNGAVLVDRRVRGRYRVGGAKAADLVTGLVTNDVAALAPGHGCYAAALSPKGKIVADLRILAMADGLLVDAPVRAREGWLGMLRKYVNPRVAPYEDITATTCAVGLFGPSSHQIASTLSGVSAPALGALPSFAHVQTELAGAVLHVARVPDLGVEGFEIIAPLALHDLLWTGAIAEGAAPAGRLVSDIARVEAGRPEWGIDMDDTTIPQEANFDELHAISYTKGCYVGQEIVARVHFRGHVNRHLRGLRADGEAGREALPRGASLFDESGKPVGDVRSAVVSPRLGAIALAMVRREIALGARLVARWDGGEQRVSVEALPFVA